MIKWNPGLFLRGLTCKSQKVFDESFFRIMKERHPDWYTPLTSPTETMEESKRVLLAMPARSPKPMRRTETGDHLYKLTAGFKNNKNYDAEFDRVIRERQPSWFNDSDKKKRTLLAMPPGCEKPKTNSSVLGRALRKYTYKNNHSYDAEFDKVIRDRQPKWFLTINQKKKRDMLAMPEGCDKPPKKGIGRFLKAYTAKGSKCYDAGFDKAIRDRHPQWFNGKGLVSLLSKNANQTKMEILGLTPGTEKPKNRNLSNLYYYMERDAEFSKAVHERQPQWFRRGRAKRA